VVPCDQSAEKSLFTFDVNMLTDKARICVIHVTSKVSNNGARSVSNVLASIHPDSNVFTIVTFDNQENASSVGSKTTVWTILSLITLILYYFIQY
jgi:hypothetical protein